MKNTLFRNTLITGVVGIVAFGSISILTGQGPAAPAPKTIPAPADLAKAPADAVKTKSGLVSKVLKVGTGKEKPSAVDKVTVHYTGWSSDGKMFDSSITRGMPATFALSGRLIKGWKEGLQLMVVGEKRRFWIPADLAYGKGPTARIPGDLCFDIELLKFKKEPKPIPAPKDFAAAPADAEKTASGLAFKILKAGTGKEKPATGDTVTVHFTGWDKTGKMIQSSVVQKQPSKFVLRKASKSWIEAIPLMVVGEKRRLWVPGPPNVNGKPGFPNGGDLCFDVELLKFKKAPVEPKAPADVAAAPADAVKSKSGVASKVLKAGTGTVKPTDKNYVIVDFSGWQKDGKLFDSSVMRGVPAAIPLGKLDIAGWKEGIKMMVVGEKRRLWIPAKLAFGEVAKRPGAPAGDMCFEIELLSIGNAPDDAKAPENITNVPKEAIKGVEGVQSLVKVPGKGDAAGEKDVLVFEYTAWDKAGKVFDGAKMAGTPFLLSVEDAPPIFKKEMEKMQVGEVRNFWITSSALLGDNPRPGSPKGPFCFQFNLKDIIKK